jgi:hypothetical protein
MNDSVVTEIGKTPVSHKSQELAALIELLIVGLHQGQRPYAPRRKAGHMTAADQFVRSGKMLAMRPSTYVA